MLSNKRIASYPVNKDRLLINKFVENLLNLD